MPPEVSLRQRQSGLDPVCPAYDGKVYSENGYDYAILCDYDYPGNDLPAQPASNMIECLAACDNYQRDINQQNGASCVAVSYNSANVNGNPCYLKSAVKQVTTNQIRVYVGRRIQYNVGDAPIYSSIGPNGATTISQPAQASTSVPVVASSVSRSSTSSRGVSSSNGQSIQYSTLISIKTVVTGIITTRVSTISGLPSATQTSNSLQTNTIPASTSNSASASTASPSSSSSTTSSSSSSSSSSTQSSTGLSDGAKIGIGVGIGVAGAIILALLLYIFCTRRQRRKRNNEPLDSSTTAKTPAELDQSSRSTSHKPVLLPHNTTHPSSEKSHHPTAMSELSSPTPVAAELDTPKYELPAAGAGGAHSGTGSTRETLVSPASTTSPTTHTSGSASGSATLGPSTVTGSEP